MNLIGDALHNLIDGLVIGGTYLVSIPLGIATTLAVLFHEIPQELGDFGVLLHGGFTKRKALIMNFLTALTAILGVIIALILGQISEGFMLFVLPFTAGGFIYIATADLIPELKKETGGRKSILQLIGIVLGIGVMLCLLVLIG
jgi:zinc and cadmium transporter